MEWGKFVLVFQAVVTLLIGIILLLQLFAIDNVKATKEQQIKNLNVPSDVDIYQFPQFANLQDLSFRFQTGSYVLVIVSLIELIIISRLL